MLTTPVLFGWTMGDQDGEGLHMILLVCCILLMCSVLLSDQKEARGEH